MRLLNIRPSAGGRFVLGFIPIALLVLLYVLASAQRHEINPNDKILPTVIAMADAVKLMAFTTDPLTGRIALWADTAASLQRLGFGLAIATLTALCVGLLLGLLPIIRAKFGPLLALIGVIPPIAVLPILFIVFGLGETAKVALIVIGITPFLARDLSAHIASMPEEMLIKAQTLGASTWQTALRIALPYAAPRLIDGLRLSLGPAWVFLISAEAIASDVGLGYRIFLVRRYLSMDIILPYVAWISLLAVVMDFALTRLNRAAFPWAQTGRQRT